jgi:hypothetical protein
MNLWIAAAAFGTLALSAAGADGELAHTRSEVRFTLDLPYDTAAPLFGALAEMKWSPGWKPQFVYPVPAEDREGAVFRVQPSPDHSSIWITTVFDLAAGHVQYVYVLNDAMITRIDIHLNKDGPGKTGVSVAYERTALIPDANEHVRRFARSDAKHVPDWKRAIEASVSKSK